MGRFLDERIKIVSKSVGHRIHSFPNLHNLLYVQKLLSRKQFTGKVLLNLFCFGGF